MEIRTLLYKSQPSHYVVRPFPLLDAVPRPKPEHWLLKLKKMAATRTAVSLAGPTALGKTRIARWVHDLSERARGPFAKIDLLHICKKAHVNTLFGKGGACAQAAQGTLFLDNIDYLDSEAKDTLVDVIESEPGLIRLVVGSNIVTNSDRQSSASTHLFGKLDAWYVPLSTT